MIQEPRVKFELHHWPVRQIVDTFTSDRLNLQPVFQRASVWREQQRRHLLDSLLQNYPIPSIFLYRRLDTDSGRVVFEVMDGKQRIESILMFMGHIRGKFDVSVQRTLESAPEMMDYKCLCKLKLQSTLEEYQIQVVEVSGELSDIIELFVRINSTGNALSRQEVRNAKFYQSEFLKTAKTIALRNEEYLQGIGVIGAQQVRRMKHIELMSELLYAAHLGGVANKKHVLDAAMRVDGLKGIALKKATQSTVSGLNRLRKMFPKVSRSTRFHKVSDFYSLAVLVQTLDREGAVLTDLRRNTLAWDILEALSTGVDQLADASRKLDFKKLTIQEEVFLHYLQTVREGSDAESHRKKRHSILHGLLAPIFEYKDPQRLFSPEQRRILWNTAEKRVCEVCKRDLTWSDFHADHIKPFSQGGRTTLDNAARLCAEHNQQKGNKTRA